MSREHTLLLLEATISHVLTGYMYLMQLFFIQEKWIISLVIAKSYTSWNAWHLRKIHLPKCHVNLCIFQGKFRENMFNNSFPTSSQKVTLKDLNFLYYFCACFKIFGYFTHFNKMYSNVILRLNMYSHDYYAVIK